MHNREVLLERVWRLGTRFDRAISLCLLPASWIYAFGWVCYQSVYQFRLKSRKKVEGLKIVCVGNLEVGGLGKTPVSIEIAKLLSKMGVRFAIGMSGYGSPSSVGAAIAPEGKLDPKLHGDEACVVRSSCPSTNIILGRDRVAAAILAKSLRVDVLLMDDGFQHLPLARDCDLLLWDAHAKNRRCLPAGPFRQPISGKRFATAILANDCSSPSLAPCFRYGRKYSHFESIDGQRKHPIESLRSENVDVLCALGRPSQFVETVRSLVAEIKNVYLYPDHDPLDSLPPEVGKERLCVVTEKDAVKLEANGIDLSRFVILKMEVEFAEKEAFEKWLASQMSL